MLFRKPVASGLKGGGSAFTGGLRGESHPVADYTLLAGFSSWSKRDGERIAVIDEETSITYAELDRRSNQLARVLQSRGVGPGAFVGIAIDRSVNLLIALFAVVKAGGAYIPLDPSYPDARLSLMLERSRPRVVLTLDRHASRLSTPADTTLFCLDTEDAAIASASGEELAQKAGPGDPLYVIFTSGSTGEPKGAIVQRHGFANLIEWFVRDFAIHKEDRVLLLSSPSFDLTQKNFFAPLCAGATLVCYPSGSFDLTKLVDLIERHCITILNCTPSAFYPLIDPPADLSRIASLRLAVLGGEPISVSRVRPWLEYPAAHAEIANTYGPTECTDICAFYRMDRSNLDQFSSVPLGGAISNVQLAVVNDSLQCQSQGEPGELVIGGIGVGLGYLNPEQTAERFIPNTLPDILEGPTIYRTGDRVRLLPEGVLEFLGRADHQVKLRGFRIELPEIETTLSAHPQVRESAVIIRESEGRTELLAFHVPKDAAASSEDLHAFLSTKLPEYMVPRQFIAMDAFPLTPNGKVDRLRLAAEQTTSSGYASTPESPLESSVHALWAEALGHHAIGLDDNFFDIGGDSIQLARVHAQLTEMMGSPIPITDLFANPTVRSLARHLSGSAPEPKRDDIRQRALKQRGVLSRLRSMAPRT